jgi:prepilin-type N-terminal cleavage/methylation domain-containing protein
MKRAAFTLIELMIAIAILATLTAAAVLSFAAPLREAQFREAIDVVRSADANARTEARHFGRRVNLVFHPGQRVIERCDVSGAVTARTQLPASVVIDELRINGKRSFDTSGIPVSELGLSPTFAVRLVSGDRTQWLGFAGLSGQMTVVNNDAELASIFNGR